MAGKLTLPGDPEFRLAFLAYLEWGTRIAIINSSTTEVPEKPDVPMPQLGWGVLGRPYQSKT